MHAILFERYLLCKVKLLGNVYSAKSKSNMYEPKQTSISLTVCGSQLYLNRNVVIQVPWLNVIIQRIHIVGLWQNLESCGSPVVPVKRKSIEAFR